MEKNGTLGKSWPIFGTIQQQYELKKIPALAWPRLDAVYAGG